jgi:hypothetical protein
MRNFVSLLFLLIVLSSCGNKTPKQDDIDRAYYDSIYNVRDSIERAEERSRLDSIIREQEKLKKEQSISFNSSSSRSSHKVKQDYMRGFDPASEDDMDDNGMSRYMENNDEEGWD